MLRAQANAAVRRLRKMAAALEWRLRGRPHFGPSDPVKVEAVKKVGRERGLRVLIETGTYQGGMIDATRDCFDQIFSIELDRDLHEMVARRYREIPGVHLLLGDSAKVLPDVLAQLRDPALFWLDAHYSAGISAWSDSDTPILQELAAVMAHPIPGHAILIDDARLFGSHPAYPPVAQVEEFASQRWPGAAVTVENDIIRILRST